MILGGKNICIVLKMLFLIKHQTESISDRCSQMEKSMSDRKQIRPALE